MRGHSGVESWQAHPKTKNSLILDTLNEAIHKSFVGELSCCIYMSTILLFFILRILVLTLSKGRTTKETATPDIAEAANRIFMVSFFYPRYFMICSLDSL